VEADQIKVTGLMVRCLMCGYIFMIYPPDNSGLPVTEDTNIDQSILDDLFEMQNDPAARISISGFSEEGHSAKADNNKSVGDIGDQDSGLAPDEAEYADLPDLSELEKMIDWDDIKDLDDPPAKFNQDYNDPKGVPTT
jgi:hypothetical protein